jgi:hypothetical protein
MEAVLPRPLSQPIRNARSMLSERAFRLAQKRVVSLAFAFPSGGRYAAATRKTDRTSSQRRTLKGWFMNDRQFDGWAREVATATNRRQIVKRLFALGAVVAGVAVQHDGESARRGYSGPPIPPVGCQPQCVGNSCGSNGCGGTCACRFGCFCLAGAATGFPNASATCVVEWVLPQGNLCKSSGDCAYAGPGHVCDVPSGICFRPCQS